MNKYRLSSSLILIAVSLAACAPASPTASPDQPTAIPSASPFPALSITSTPAAASSTETAVPSPLPVATSRGPELHASDPSTVSLDSGGLQLVEFFRFT